MEKSGANGGDGGFSIYDNYPIVKAIRHKFKQDINWIEIIEDECRCLNAVFVTASDCVYAFGDNTGGCLGVGHKRPLLYKSQIISELKYKSIVKIVSGLKFVLALSLHGRCWWWGDNMHMLKSEDESGSLTPRRLMVPEYRSNKVKNIFCGSLFGCFLTLNDELYSFGDNTYGQLGVNIEGSSSEPIYVPVLEPVVEVSCGANHMAFLTKDRDKLYVCGSNRFGQLGFQEIESAEGPMVNPHIVLKKNQTIKTVSCGHSHTLVMLSNGSIYSFGDNQFGQLGTPSPENETSISKPQIILIEAVFCKLFLRNLSHLSVAKCTTGKYYVWGPVQNTRTYQQLKYQIESGQIELISKKDTNRENKHCLFFTPRTTFVLHIQKIFALFETRGLNYNEMISNRKLPGKIFKIEN